MPLLRGDVGALAWGSAEQCWGRCSSAGRGTPQFHPAEGGHVLALATLSHLPWVLSVGSGSAAPAALTGRVDGVQCHLPGTYEPAHLLQVPLPYVVLEDDVVGEVHRARGSQSPAVPGQRRWVIVLHTDRSLQPLQRRRRNSGVGSCRGSWRCSALSSATRRPQRAALASSACQAPPRSRGAMAPAPLPPRWRPGGCASPHCQALYASPCRVWEVALGTHSSLQGRGPGLTLPQGTALLYRLLRAILRTCGSCYLP